MTCKIEIVQKKFKKLLLDCLKIFRWLQLFNQFEENVQHNGALRLALQKYPVYNLDRSGQLHTFLEQKTFNIQKIECKRHKGPFKCDYKISMQVVVNACVLFGETARSRKQCTQKLLTNTVSQHSISLKYVTKLLKSNAL